MFLKQRHAKRSSPCVAKNHSASADQPAVIVGTPRSTRLSSARQEHRSSYTARVKPGARSAASWLLVAPVVVDRVFLPPLEGGKWCPHTLHNGRVISILLTEASPTIPESFNAVTSCLNQYMTHFFNELFRLSTKQTKGMAGPRYNESFPDGNVPESDGFILNLCFGVQIGETMLTREKRKWTALTLTSQA